MDQYKRQKKYWQKHKDEINARRRSYHAQYRKNNKDRIRLHKYPYRAMYDENGGEWKCYCCGVTQEDGVQLDIHHKDQDKTNNEFNNLVCLCSRCHNELHKKWANVIIPQLIHSGLVSWTGDITHEE